MLYLTRIRSQKVWVVYVYYRFIFEQCDVHDKTVNNQVSTNLEKQVLSAYCPNIYTVTFAVIKHVNTMITWSIQAHRT